LVAEAEALGIIRQQGKNILGRLGYLRKAKLEKIKNRKVDRYVTMAFSAEMAGQDGISMLDVENLQEENGSVGHSPAATAYFATIVKPGDAASLKCLKQTINEDGSISDLAPFEIYEIAWVVWNLALLEHNDEKNNKLIHKHLKYLNSCWSPRGMPLSKGFSVPDGDNTSVTFELLTKYGYPADMDGLLSFEEDSHFKCYELEANPSASVNIHVIGALKQAGFPNDHPKIKKIAAFLESQQNEYGYWFDKWNISPYYTATHAIIACAGYLDYLIAPTVEWIIKTQRHNGSWGFYLPTAEETAYCLQALSIWKKRFGKNNTENLDVGVSWLNKHMTGTHPLFWIGKGLYASELIVKSEILSALALVQEVK